jgi:hypothetical protein
VAGGRREANGGFPLPDSIPYHLPPAASRLAVARKPEAANPKPEAEAGRESGDTKVDCFAALAMTGGAELAMTGMGTPTF